MRITTFKDFWTKLNQDKLDQTNLQLSNGAGQFAEKHNDKREREMRIKSVTFIHNISEHQDQHLYIEE